MADKQIVTSMESLILVNLLLAHFAADFLFQSKKIVESKSWFSPYLFLHISIVYFISAIVSGYWIESLFIATVHYFTDGLKTEAQKRNILSGIRLFLLDQFVHMLTIFVVWAAIIHKMDVLIYTLRLPFGEFNLAITLLGYIVVTFPIGFLVRFFCQSFINRDDLGDNSAQNAGMWIGIFERIIILTFVLLNQYEAIGFLITGKSIIRFAGNKSELKSEYVLLGTMLSVGSAIMMGILICRLID